VCKKLIKHSQPFGKKIQKTVGQIFLTHTVEHETKHRKNIKKEETENKQTQVSIT